MYTKILIPLDGSSLAEQVLPYGRFLAKALRIPVQLLKVLDVNELELTTKVRQGLCFENLSHRELTSRNYLEAVARSFETTQVSCSVHAGKAREVINQKASADQNALIVMATHGSCGIRRWLLGSVANKLLQEAANDMFLIRVTDEGRTDGEARLTTALIPLDGSRLAEQVLPRTEELAERIGLKLLLLRVCAWEPALTIHPYTPSMNQWFSLGGESQQYLGAKVQELGKKGLVDVEPLVKSGYAPDQIIGTAEETRDSFIAMCTHGNSGMNRWVLGSVTNTVVRHSRGPVLVIRGNHFTRATNGGSRLFERVRESKTGLAVRVSKRQEKHHVH